MPRKAPEPVKVGENLLIYPSPTHLDFVAFLSAMHGHANISNRVSWDIIIDLARIHRPDVFKK